MSAAAPKFEAYVAKEKGAKWVKEEWTGRPMTSGDVTIDIECCGICHSDFSMCNNLWGISQYPMCAGHEGIGKVTAMGDDVKGLKIGQRVGVGWNREACETCIPCLGGEQTRCTTQIPVPNITSVLSPAEQSGCFAKQVVIPGKWAFPIPDSLKSEEVAPFMCAGITVYAPLRQYAKPGMHVGVIGIGGLGHIAVQFAAKMGCIVHAFSTTDRKKDLAIKLGAKDFTATKDDGQMKAAMQTCDIILNTVGEAFDFTPFIGNAGDVPGVLRNSGVFVQVGAPAAPDSATNKLALMPLIFGHKAIVGSATGGVLPHTEMIKFIADHDIKCMVEVWDFDKINEAMDHMMANKAQFRVVLKW